MDPADGRGPEALNATPARGEAAPCERLAGQLATLVHGLLYLRLGWLAATIVLLGRGGLDRPGLSLVVVGIALASLVPLWYAQRSAPAAMPRRLWLALDLVAAITVLVLTGASGPFLPLTLTTAAVAGVLFGWWGGGVVGFLLGGFVLVVLLWDGGGNVGDLAAKVGIPALYPMVGVGAAGIRTMLQRQAAAEQALARARERLAVGQERARLAREMHDSVAGTLNGLALTAMAIRDAAVHDPPRAAEAAQVLGQAAQEAAAEIRVLIHDLREDRLAQPLAETIETYLAQWSARTGVRTEVSVEAVQPAPSVAYELFAILKEALRNVERHAEARTVLLDVFGSSGAVSMVISDDGRGMEGPVDLQELAMRGRYGLIGMRERARRVGGDLRVESGPGRGITLAATVPLTPPEA